MPWQRRLRAQEWGELQMLLRSEQSAGKRVVFTNGVFDLIHPGHIRYLAAARAMGDLLVVGINSDESVKRLKGPDRPILPEHERVKIVASLEAVDYVSLFEEDTPLELITRLRPNVLVKGGDYSSSEIVGREVVEAGGGEVKTLQFVTGASSTNIIERILAKGK